MTIEAVVVGRAAADLYPVEARTHLRFQREFHRFLGGSGANIAVGLARLGVPTALVAAVGDDGHGDFVVDRLDQEGVDTHFVARVAGSLTPLTFCELWPPDRFPVTMYRCAHSPDWSVLLTRDDIASLATAPLLVVTVSALARDPSRASTSALLAAHRGLCVVDLDLRRPTWDDIDDYVAAARAATSRAFVAIGNEEEIAVAGPVEAPIVVTKRGEHGVSYANRGEVVDIPPVPVETCNGLGAGDAFAAALGARLVAGGTIDAAVRDGATAGAIVASRLACADAMPTFDELRRVTA